ncbi:PREDICTED: transcription factor bHLH96-like [Tarenaya hassleriana]|uniref:transcription factor bHLH96-like n=1 Tax=Tarenaya hassleriana TaxID=28532 RepID=UPI00053C776F|nr:PREDICTED: transcription factor bHLH96-like [Tarenaya hassleriana]
MALEAVVYPQDPFGYVSCKDFLFHDLYFQEDRDGDTKSNIKLGQEQEQGFACNHYTNHTAENDNEDSNLRATEDRHHPWQDHVQCPLIPSLEGFGPLSMDNQPPPDIAVVAAGGRRKRRRTRSSKNKEEIENQRMTHIAVERNRRKQMNEYLAVLRSLMPPTYAQRGDQASIIGGAINYVKELEHLLQSMEPKKKTQNSGDDDDDTSSFSDFFTFPQYTLRPSESSAAAAEGTAEIEVTMAESNANLKILTKKRPRQLLKLVSAIQSLRLTLLHLNVTTLDHSVLYSISVKVEEGSQLNTVDDIAAAVNQILKRVEEESAFS